MACSACYRVSDEKCFCPSRYVTHQFEPRPVGGKGAVEACRMGPSSRFRFTPPPYRRAKTASAAGTAEYPARYAPPPIALAVRQLRSRNSATQLERTANCRSSRNPRPAVAPVATGVHSRGIDSVGDALRRGGSQRWLKSDASGMDIQALAAQHGGQLPACYTAGITDQPFQPLAPLLEH